MGVKILRSTASGMRIPCIRIPPTIRSFVLVLMFRKRSDRLAVHRQMLAKVRQHLANLLYQPFKHQFDQFLLLHQGFHESGVDPRRRNLAIKAAHLPQLTIARQFPPQFFHAIMLKHDSRQNGIPHGTYRIVVPSLSSLAFKGSHQFFVRHIIKY